MKLLYKEEGASINIPEFEKEGESIPTTLLHAIFWGKAIRNKQQVNMKSRKSTSETIKTLLSIKCDINELQKWEDTTISALHFAILAIDDEACDTLLKYGAEVSGFATMNNKQT
eukprot:UN03910